MNLKLATKLAAFGALIKIILGIFDCLLTYKILEITNEDYNYVLILNIIPWIFFILFFLTLSKKQK